MTGNTEYALSCIQDRVSSQCLDLLRSMLLRNPTHRPSPKEALQHEWFQCDKATLTNLLIVNKFLCAQSFEEIEQDLIDLHHQYQSEDQIAKNTFLLGSLFIRSSFERNDEIVLSLNSPLQPQSQAIGMKDDYSPMAIPQENFSKKSEIIEQLSSKLSIHDHHHHRGISYFHMLRN